MVRCSRRFSLTRFVCSVTSVFSILESEDRLEAGCEHRAEMRYDEMKLRNILLITPLMIVTAVSATFAQSAIDGFKPDVNGLVQDVEIGQARFKYIGGLFSQVNGTARTNLARLHHNGDLDVSYNPAPNGVVGD